MVVDQKTPAADENPQPSTSGESAVPQIVPVRRRWLKRACVALPMAAITAFVVWWLQTPVYTATAILRLAPTESTLLFETAESKSSSISFDFYKRSHRQWLQSRFVLARALRDSADLAQIPALQKEASPVDWLATNLCVTFPDDCDMMQVSLSGERPDGLDKLVNAVVKAYFDEIVNKEVEKKRERLNSLEVAYRVADQELRAKRHELKLLVERVGGDSTALSLVQQGSLNQITAFQQQYAKVRFELMRAQSELESAERISQAEIALSEHEVLLAMKIDAVAAEIRAEKQRVLDHLQRVKQKAENAGTDPKLEEFEKRLVTCEEKYQDRKTELQHELIEQKRQAKAAQIDSLNHKLQSLAAQETQLKKKSSELEADVKQIGKSSIDVEIMRSEIATVQDVAGRLSAEFERARVELQNDGRTGWARVTLKSEATAPHRTASRIRLPATIGAGLASLLFTLCLVLWLDFRRAGRSP